LLSNGLYSAKVNYAVHLISCLKRNLSRHRRNQHSQSRLQRNPRPRLPSQHASLIHLILIGRRSVPYPHRKHSEHE
jgi:hypothetical protein